MDQAAARTRIVQALQETAVFLRPLNYFWFKEIQKLIEGSGQDGWIEKVSAAVLGRNQLCDLFISPPKEREQFAVLLRKLKETLEPVS